MAKKKTPTFEQFEAKQKLTPPSDKPTVKVRAIRPFEIVREKAIVRVEPGREALLTEAEAVEFCDTKWTGYHPFYGYMPEFGPLLENQPNPLARKQIVRAERVA